MNARSSSPAAEWMACVAMIAVGGGLLAYAALAAPDDACAPAHAPALIAVAFAQGAALIAVVLATRASGPRAAAAVALAWVLGCAVPLASLASGGGPASLGTIDVVHVAGGAVALGLLASGLAARLASRRAGALAGGAAVMLAAGWSAAWLCSSRPAAKMVLSWSLLNDAASVLDAAVVGGARPAGEDVELASIQAALPEGLAGELPVRDAWGMPLRYSRTDAGFSVRSLGADGRPGPRSAGPIREFRGDLVIADGTFVSWPERPCSDDPALRTPPAIDLRPR